MYLTVDQRLRAVEVGEGYLRVLDGSWVGQFPLRDVGAVSVDEPMQGVHRVKLKMIDSPDYEHGFVGITFDCRRDAEELALAIREEKS